MGSVYSKYLKLKKEDSKKIYLFKSGSFYIFLDNDAYEVCKKVPLKLTRYNNIICKCGFPINSYDRYMEVFDNLGLDIRVVSRDEEEIRKYLNKICELDLDNITPLESINILSRLQELL